MHDDMIIETASYLSWRDPPLPKLLFFLKLRDNYPDTGGVFQPSYSHLKNPLVS